MNSTDSGWPITNTTLFIGLDVKPDCTDSGVAMLSVKRKVISPLSQDPEDPSRRGLLMGMLTLYTASLIPWAVAQTAPDAERGAFMAVSAIIAGRQSLNAELSATLFDALTEADPGFPAATSELLQLINERQIDPLQLQAMLESEYPTLAPVPRKIATGWFLGIVGDGGQTHCLAYENALNAVFVSDVLKPPGYCYGAYGSWASKPV